MGACYLNNRTILGGAVFLGVWERRRSGGVRLNYDFFLKKICIIEEKVVSLQAN